MSTVRMTTAEALVRHLVAQRTVVDGRSVPLLGGVFAIFGHGNVTGLGAALYDAADILPTYRGQNEQVWRSRPSPTHGHSDGAASWQ